MYVNIFTFMKKHKVNTYMHTSGVRGRQAAIHGIYKYMYIYIYIHIFIYTYIYIYIYIHIRVRIYTFVQILKLKTYIHTSGDRGRQAATIHGYAYNICRRLSRHAYKCIYILYMYICTYIYGNTYRYMYVHIQKCEFECIYSSV